MFLVLHRKVGLVFTLSKTIISDFWTQSALTYTAVYSKICTYCTLQFTVHYSIQCTSDREYFFSLLEEPIFASTCVHYKVQYSVQYNIQYTVHYIIQYSVHKSIEYSVQPIVQYTVEDAGSIVFLKLQASNLDVFVQ